MNRKRKVPKQRRKRRKIKEKLTRVQKVTKILIPFLQVVLNVAHAWRRTAKLLVVVVAK